MMTAPEFDFGLHATYLIYSQFLMWLGLYFSPLFPLISCLVLVITFYFRRLTLKINMNQSSDPWRASRTLSVLHLVTFISIIVSSSVFLFVITSRYIELICMKAIPSRSVAYFDINIKSNAVERTSINFRN